MGRLQHLLIALIVSAASSGCLVLSVNPGFDETTIAWEPSLIGHWVDADDNATLQIERGEWKSYRIHYIHPIETGDLTGYLTAIGNERYLDVMPARGEDRGSFLLPLHAILHLRLDGDRLELTPLAYEWFNEHLRAGRPVPGSARRSIRRRTRSSSRPSIACGTGCAYNPSTARRSGRRRRLRASPRAEARVEYRRSGMRRLSTGQALVVVAAAWRRRGLFGPRTAARMSTRATSCSRPRPRRSRSSTT